MWLAPVNGQDILQRTREFSRRIAKLHAALPKNSGNKDIASQLLRAGTSVGAQVAEANFAKSKADFINKLEGALQESEEARYWIKVIGDAELVKPSRLDAIFQESKEITAIIVTIVNKTRRSRKAE